MVPTVSPPEAVRKQLDRVLASSGFGHNDRLSRFLRFVVERQLEGRDGELKESLIAVEVFGRKPDYDPKQDSIVRSEAARLRARLLAYYAGPGSGDELIIELPKGGYAPLCRRVETPPLERRSRSGSLVLMALLVGLSVTLTAVSWRWVRRNAAPVAIAVLPLTNLSQDPADDYFTDGLTDEIIRNLSIIDGLAVRSQTSSFAFKGKYPNVREVSRQLEVDYILEGSVLRSVQQLRINVQFIRARDDVPLWSAKYDREAKDVLAIQDEISRGIVNSLRLQLGRGRRRYETSVEAYDYYLRGRALQIQRGPVGNLESLSLFQDVIAREPSFAPAYAALAASYAYRSGQFEFDRADELVKMRAAAEKAIQLDPLLAEAHAALGTANARDAHWDQAEKSFLRAIELDPNRSTSYSDFSANLLLPLGRIDEALRQLRTAERADPLSPAVLFRLAWALISAERYGEAADYCQKLPSDQVFRSQCLGRARLGQGSMEEGIRIFATAVNRGVPAGAAVRGYLGYAYARAGRREEAEKIAAAVSPNPFQQALVFSGLSDKDRAFEALDRMAALGPVRLGRALTYPEFAPLRGDLRLKALRRKVGLPEQRLPIS